MQKIWSIVILRLSFGSSPLTDAGGVMADIFTAREHGFSMIIFAAAPFMGPVMVPGFWGNIQAG
jgi:hypothetical protein